MNQILEINLSKPLGLTAGVVVREVARELPDYYHPVSTDLKGQDKDGKEILVNTLGRWMFGVPGYDGAARIVPEGTKVLIHYPEHSAEFVHEFMALLKHKIEAGQAS